jgi:hypothetical protein
MYLEISGERSISETQQEFRGLYPFLNLEFFRNGRIRHDRYHASKKIPVTRLLKDAWHYKKFQGQLEISDQMTVTDLEMALMNEFGLSAQVFRRSGNLWIETTITDCWTLRQQNEHGRELTQGHA